MSDQPHRLHPPLDEPHGLDLPHGLDPSLNQQLPLDQQHGLDQPHRPDERDQTHRPDASLDQPHRLSASQDQPHGFDQQLPLDQPHQPNQLDDQASLDTPDLLHRLDLPLDQPHALDHLAPQLPPDLPPVLESPDSESGQSSSPSESVSEGLPGSSNFPVEPQKICYTCAQFLPASQFRFRNRATGVRMTECRTCYNKRTKDWHRKKRAREKGWEIHKTASQIARSPDISRTVALLENLVDVMGGPEKLIEQWHAECFRLINQKRSSTRLARMHEMLIVLMQQTRRA